MYTVSCRGTSYDDVQCHVMCNVMSCHVMSCHVMSCNTMSCHAMSCNHVVCHLAPSNVIERHVIYVMIKHKRHISRNKNYPIVLQLAHENSSRYLDNPDDHSSSTDDMAKQNQCAQGTYGGGGGVLVEKKLNFPNNQNPRPRALDPAESDNCEPRGKVACPFPLGILSLGFRILPQSLV